MRTRVGKILRGLGRLLLGLVVLLGLLWVLRVPLFGGLVKREITSRLEEAVGGRYAIDGVGGSWITGLRLEGLRTIESPPSGPLVGVSFDRAEVEYDLLGLLGDAPLGAIDTVRVDGGRLELDATRAMDGGSSESPDLDALDAFQGSVDVTFDVVVETGEGRAAVQGLSAGLGPGRPLELAVEEIVLPEQLDVRGPFAGRMERVDADTWRWTSDASLGEVRIPEATIHRDGRVAATLEVAGGGIAMAVDAERVTATVEAVDLAQLPAWILDHLPDDVQMPTSGRIRGSVAVPWGAEPFATSFDLAIEQLVWFEQRIDRVQVSGSSAGSRLTIVQVDAAGEGARLLGRDLLLDLEAQLPLRGARSVAVDVDSLRAFFPDLVHDVAVSLSASGPVPDRLTVERLLLRHGEDRVEVRGELRIQEAPELWRDLTVDLEVDGRIVDPAALDLPWSGAVRIEGTAVGPTAALALNLAVSGEAIAVEGRPVDGARLVGTLDWPELDVSTLEVHAPGLAVDASGRVSLEPIRFSDAVWRLEIEDLAQVAGLLPADAPSLTGRVRSEGRLSWNGTDWTGNAEVAASDLSVDEQEIGVLEARLAGGAAGPLQIRALEASGPWGHVRGSASVDLRAERAVVETLAVGDGVDAAARASLRAPLRVLWDGGEVRLADGDLDVDGARVRLDASVRPEQRDAQILRLEVESPELRLRLAELADVRWQDDVVTVSDLAVVVGEDLRFRTSLFVDLGAESATIETLEAQNEELSGRLLAPLHLALRGDEIVVRDLDGMAEGIRFQGAGRARLDEETAILESLRVWDGDLAAQLEAPVRVAWRDGSVSAEGLDVAVLGGRVRGRAAWDGALHAALAAEGVALGQWVEALDGQVDARIEVDGERLVVRAQVPDLTFDAWEGAVAVEAVQDESGPLRIENVRLRGPRGRTLAGRATLPYRLAPEGLIALDGVQPTLTLQGALGGLGLFTDVADGPVSVRVTGDAQGLAALVRIADVGLCDETAPCDDVALDLRISPAEVKGRIALGSDNFLKLRGHLNLDRGFDWTHPETLASLVADATLDAAVDALVESWAPLAKVAPGVRRLQGGTRLTLQAQGPLRAPSIAGVLTLSQVGIELETDLAPFEQVDARLVWKDDLIRVEQLKGLMGFAPFAIQGDIRLLPDSLPVLDLTLKGRNTQLIRTEWFRMRIDIDGQVTGPLDRMHIAGNGRIVDSIYREPVSLTGASGVGDSPELILFEIDDAPFDEMTFDLGIHADRTIHIRNNLLRVDVSFEGRLKGKGARPAIEGLATFRNAEIQLPLTTLRNGTGKIEFLPGSAGRPRIQMTTHTRTKGFEMGLQLAGRLPDVNLHVFTEPPLSDEDAMLMLATGSTGAELASGGIVGKTLSGVVSIFGGSLFTSRGDEGEPGEKAFFERFEVSADLDGTDVRELDAEFELNERFYLHIQRDRFEATNLGLIWRIRFR